jgi:hypothetical protein
VEPASLRPAAELDQAGDSGVRCVQTDAEEIEGVGDEKERKKKNELVHT